MITDRGLPFLSEINVNIQALLVSTTNLSSGTSPASSSLSPSLLVEDQNPHLLKICLYVEKILSYELRDVNFIGATHLWDFVQNLPKCLPDTAKIIELTKDCAKTSIGRGRVFIRQSLNEGSLGPYLSALYFNQSIIRSYYKESSYLRNPEFSSTFLSILDTLSHIQFGLVVRDKDLDKPSYWDDITLTLLADKSRIPNIQLNPPQLLNNNNLVEKEDRINVQKEIIEQQQDKSNSTSNELSVSEKNQDQSEQDSEDTMMEDDDEELDINSLNEILDEMSKEDEEMLNTQINETNQLRWNVLIDSLSRASKSLLLDYGGKGSPLNNQDRCIETFYLTFDQIISNDLLTSILNRWICIEKLCDGSLDVQQIQQVYSSQNGGSTQTQNMLLDTRFKAWVFKLLSDGTMAETLRSRFTNESVLRELYNSNSILLSVGNRTKVIDTVADLVSKVHFQLSWDKLDATPTSSKKVIHKIIKKKIRRVKSTGDATVSLAGVTPIGNTKVMMDEGGAGDAHSSQSGDFASKVVNHHTRTIDNTSATSSPFLDSSSTTSSSGFSSTNQSALVPPPSTTFSSSSSSSSQPQQSKSFSLINNNSNDSIDQMEQQSSSSSDDQPSQPTLLCSFDESLAAMLRRERIQASTSNNVNNNVNSTDQPIIPTTTNITKVQPRSSLLSSSHLGDYLSNLVDKDENNPVYQYNNNNGNRSRSSSRGSTTSNHSANINIVNSHNSHHYQHQHQHQQSSYNASNGGGIGAMLMGSSVDRYRSNSNASVGSNGYGNGNNNGYGNNNGNGGGSRKNSNSGMMMDNNSHQVSSSYGSNNGHSSSFKPTTSSSALTPTSSTANNRHSSPNDKDAYVSPTYIPNNPYLSEALKMVEEIDKEKQRMSTSVDSFNSFHLITDYCRDDNNRNSSRLTTSTFVNQNNNNNNININNQNQNQNQNTIYSSSLTNSNPLANSNGSYGGSYGNFNSSSFEDRYNRSRERRNRYAGEDDQIFVTKDHKKPLLMSSDTYQSCPGCGASLSKAGYFGTRFCSYLGEWFCTSCHKNSKISLPSRILYHWDFKLYPVSEPSKLYIQQHYSIPIDIFRSNPEVYKLSATLHKLLEIRRKLHFIGEYIETCRNKTALESLSNHKEYFINDNVHLYSLTDLDRCYTGTLLPQIETLMDKYIHHVTVSCNTCKGKGFICEFCNSDKLIFAWMKLDQQNIVQCDRCQSLSHRRCYDKDHCPKCIRISRIRSKNNDSRSSLTGSNDYNFENLDQYKDDVSVGGGNKTNVDDEW